ncbi:hypothetical protein HHI36_006554 [Cryptolaemus montrouzieri]|uniref:Uncharacterized protein n=1 Tax=Cryptolaemus montrouzieri TaxID=559131 RepID=A0ABD2NXU8_9CUCU
MRYPSPKFLTVSTSWSITVLNSRGLRLSPWRMPDVVPKCCVRVWFVRICVVVLVFRSFMSLFQEFVDTKYIKSLIININIKMTRIS